MNSSPSSSPAGPRALEALAQRLSSDPAYMAHVLVTYQAQERLDAASLAQRLGLSLESLARLALCKRPLSHGAEFATQVRQIATYVGWEPVTLAQLIRQVEGVETAKALGKGLGTATAAEATAPASASMTPGWLAAARDREVVDDDSDQEGAEGPADADPEQ